MLKKYKAAVVLGAIAFFALAGVAYANPSYFGGAVTTNNVASSSPAYMTPGTATSTTPVYDAYAPTTSSQKYKSDRASLAVQYTASSTATIFSYQVEYSNDGIDWYSNYVVDSNTISTTSPTFSVFAPVAASYKFASTTVGGVGIPAGQSRTNAYFVIATPARYTRVWFAVTGGNGGVWAQLTPIKEQY